MSLAAGVVLPAIVAEPHPHPRGRALAERERAVTHALRPEIAGVVPATLDLPVFHHRLPRLAAIERHFDLILDLRSRRVARLHVRRGEKLHSLLPAWRLQFECDVRRAELAIDDVSLSLRE